MKILGYTPYGFSLRAILITMIGFIVVVAIQMYQYMSSVDTVEQKLFTTWPNQKEVKLYRENCQKGPVSREGRMKIDHPFGKYECASKYASIELSDAIESSHNSMAEPPAPLKWL